MPAKVGIPKSVAGKAKVATPVEDVKLSGDEYQSDEGSPTVPKKSGRGRPSNGGKPKASSDNEEIVAKGRGRHSKAVKSKFIEISATGKGRGRPKKIQKLGGKDDFENGEDEDGEEEAVVETGKKTKTTKKPSGKGRGRPKLVKNSDDESSDDKMDDGEEKRPIGRPATGAVHLNILRTGRGQGRPKQKNKSNNKVVAGNDTSSVKKVGRPPTGKTPKPAYKPTGKPRGRPKPKAVNEAEEDDEEASNDDEEVNNHSENESDEIVEKDDENEEEIDEEVESVED